MFAEVSGALGEDCARWAVQALAASVLDEVMAALDHNGIPALPVKGIVTGRTLYEDAAERPLRDVDLRIRPEDFLGARDVVRHAGWPLKRQVVTYRNLIFTVRGVDVDVEGYVGPPGVCALTVDDMLARAVVGTGPGHPLRREPEIHDHAVLLCVNAFKDKIVRAAPWALEDVARIVRLRAFEDDVFVARAKTAKVRTLTWIVADWMFRERGDARWGELRAKLGHGHVPRSTYVAAFRYLQSRTGAAQSVLRGLARIVSDDPLLRVRALALAVGWEIEMRMPASGPASACTRSVSSAGR